ncbi:MAG TPA: DUF4350 domain-containing protein [Caulobacteraceae bacterium]|nr:DUF4350 domain-containing protein [Caulobacteraceae bacterium]
MTVAAAPAPKEQPVFRPLTMLLLLIAGVFSFSAFIVLSAYAPDLEGGDDGGGHALSRSAVGFAGIVRLLQADGVPVVISRDGVAKRDPNWGLLVLTPDENTKPAELMALAQAPGNTLIVLPKWEPEPDPNHAGWVQNGGVVPPPAINALLGKDLAAVVSRRSDIGAVALAAAAGQGQGGFQTGPIVGLQTLAAHGVTPLLTAPDGGVVLARFGAGDDKILSDPDLLDTQGLRDAQGARTAVQLIEHLRSSNGPVVFDVSLNGYKRSPSLLKLAFEPPFLGATLCLVGAALLMALHALSRFGAPERTERALALGKRALAENSAGLIRMAGREPHMAQGYIDLNRAAVARAVGARLSGPELDAYVDRLGERLGAGSLTSIAVQAPNVKDRPGLVRFAQRLYRWRLEMTRERR